MYVCMYVCVYVCVCVCIGVCQDVYTWRIDADGNKPKLFDPLRGKRLKQMSCGGKHCGVVTGIVVCVCVCVCVCVYVCMYPYVCASMRNARQFANG